MNVTPSSETSSCSTPRLTTHDVAAAELARLVADRHRQRALENDHHLLGVLVAVALHRRARLVGDTAEKDLVAPDRVQVDRGEDPPRLDAVPRAEGGHPAGGVEGEGEGKDEGEGEASLARTSGVQASVSCSLEAHAAVRHRIHRELLVEDDELALAARLGPRLRLERAQHALGRDRQLGDPDADRVVDRGGDRGRLGLFAISPMPFAP